MPSCVAVFRVDGRTPPFRRDSLLTAWLHVPFRCENGPPARGLVCVVQKCPLHGCACRIADVWSRSDGRFTALLQAAAQKLAPRKSKIAGGLCPPNPGGPEQRMDNRERWFKVSCQSDAWLEWYSILCMHQPSSPASCGYPWHPRGEKRKIPKRIISARQAYPRMRLVKTCKKKCPP